MKRDGASISIWQDGMNDYQAQNQWDKNVVYDVLIVGGGITGLTTALLLQHEGKKCILAEAHHIGFGTSGGTTAHLNTMLDTPYSKVQKDFGADNAKLLARGAREAIDLVEGLVNKYEIDCGFQYQTGYLFAETEDEGALLDKMMDAARDAGVAVVYSQTIPLNVSFRKAARFEFQAQIHATKYLHGLAKAFEQEGGVILQACMLTDIKEQECLHADTSLGEIKAQQVVYATHIPPGINLLSFLNAPYRSYAAAFTLKSGAYPEGLIYDLKEPYHYFRTQEIGEKKYMIVGGFDHKTGHHENTEHVFTELEAYIRKIFDVETMAYKWSSQYYEPADGLPYIGLMPGQRKSIFVATGFSGNGITLGSLAAKMICGLIANGESPYESLFAPSRIKPIAGFKNFIKENADVVSQFIGKRLAYEKIKQLAELAPGEAKVAEWDATKVAVYKDDNGELHVLDPVCPHAKCIVAWNSAEKTWDCPCHGGRYSPVGSFLGGPANRGLSQIKWEDIEGD